MLMIIYGNDVYFDLGNFKAHYILLMRLTFKTLTMRNVHENLSSLHKIGTSQNAYEIKVENKTFKIQISRPKLMGHDPQSLRQNILHNTFLFYNTTALGRIEGQNIGTNYTCIHRIHFICIKKANVSLLS